MANSITGGSIVWDFDVDQSKFQAGLAKASAEAKAFGSSINSISAQKTFSDLSTGFDKVANSIQKAGLVIGTIGGAISLFAIKSASDFEQNRVAFDVMLGSAQAAQKMMKELSDFAIRTPFRLPEVVQGAKQLLAYGIAAQDILPDFEALGNIAAGVGKDKLPFLTLAFGQVATKGKLAGQEIRQFTEAGVPLVQQLAATFHKTTSEIQAMSENGDISFAMVREAIRGMSGEGGKFFNLMERQSHTLGGVTSNIQDQFGRLSRTILGISESGDIKKGSLFEKLSTAATNFLNVLTNASPQIISFFDMLVRNGNTIASVIGALAVVFVAAKVAAIGFAIAAAINPVTLIVAGVVALIGVLTFLQLRFGLITKAIQFMKPVLDIIGSVFSDLWHAISDLATVLGKELAPVFAFVSKHAEVFKKILIALTVVALAPLIISVGLILAAFKLLALGIQTLADHFDGFKKIIKTLLIVAFAPLIAVVAPIVLLIKNWGNIMDWFGNIFSATGKIITGTASAIKDVVVGAWQAVYSVTVTVFTAIWNFISPILNFIKNLFIIVFGSILIVILTVLIAIKTVVFDVWNAIFAFMSVVLGAIWNGVTVVWNAIFLVVTTVLGWLLDRITIAFNFYKDIIINVFNAVLGFVTAVWNTIFAVVSGIVQRLIDFFAPAFSWLFERGKDIVNGLVAGIKAVAGAVWGAIKSVADQIGQFFAGAGSWLFDTGKAIVQGMINGIKSMVKAVGDAAGNIGDTVKSKVKNLLGIGSPSKVFHEYGVNLLEGMAAGIAASKSLVTDSLANFADAEIKPVVKPDISGFGLNGGTSTKIENNIGTINIASDVDAENWLQKLTRQDEVTKAGLTA